MTDADFLRGITKNPEDDARRLVYADWLEERGDKRGIDRAQHIREDIAKGTEYDDWNLGAALIICGWESSCGLLGRGGAVVRRGFVAEVRCTLTDWIKHGPAIVQTQPVEKVRFIDRRCQVDEIEGEFWWFGVLASRYSPQLIEQWRHWITLSVARHLKGQLVRHGTGEFTYIYATAAEAEDDLSRAAILWARRKRWHARKGHPLRP